MSVRRKHRFLLALGAAGPPVFIACYLANGAAQPGYSSWHDTISALSLARSGWIQVANFMLYGVLTRCFAEGLRRSGAAGGWGWRLLVIAGLGLLVIGPIRTDPILGFPAGREAVTTATGTVHTLASLVVFLAFPAAIERERSGPRKPPGLPPGPWRWPRAGSSSRSSARPSPWTRRPTPTGPSSPGSRPARRCWRPDAARRPAPVNPARAGALPSIRHCP